MKREPALNVPGSVIVLIALLLGLVLVLGRLGEEAAAGVIFEWGFVPADFLEQFGVDALQRAVTAAGRASGDEALGFAAEAASYLKGHPGYGPLTLVSYAFLHAGWSHVVVNSVWLLAFGSVVARRLGALRFLALFIVSAIGGALAHLLTHAEDVMPMIGASAAVSGIMAGAIRFVFQPGEPLSGFSLHKGGQYHGPSLPLIATFRDRRTLRFILLWLAVNIVSGLFGASTGLADGAIAWEAHLGGFVFGLLVFSLIDPPVRLVTGVQ